ncbi:MAG: protein kinase [Gammaproteobacteria bacterium]|nr:protein kinase [Gammaproteobacteria bacterium]NIR85930.1 protein kinase [Gammaproteobacteria bacterium]NIR91922.1 protein kinase [Gammaproteobacteria bacterium]NIU07179.1 protein kinase [Gammaproteobacteria bacterium]NIV53992.1 protein kinase [Gammaproteobacteria bacterium]
MSTIPEKIGKYHILGIAGRGNMGLVYTGYDPFRDRDVAVKVCSLDDDSDEKTNRVARKLFFNEARLAGILDHPSILKILDAGEDDGQPYIVMEYVEEGRTLLPYCSPSKLLPVPKVADIASKCAKALDYAHRRGVIHRDIKPTNIMLTPEGGLKIADFGIAHRPRDDTTDVSGLLGSPRYMSPEQAEEAPLNNQTDLYSLGVVTFILLTATPPFRAPNITELLQEIVRNRPPRLRTLRPDLPEGLESIVHCALEKDLTKRYRTGGEMASDLAAVFSDLDHHDESENEERRFDAVRPLGFFDECSDSELWETVRVGSWEEYAPRETIVTRARNDLSFFVVIAGDVVISRAGQALTTLSPGDCFGEMGYDDTAGADIETCAANNVKLLRLDDELMQRTSQGCQLRLTRAFLRSMINRLAASRKTSAPAQGGRHVA